MNLLPSFTSSPPPSRYHFSQSLPYLYFTLPCLRYRYQPPLTPQTHSLSTCHSLQKRKRKEKEKKKREREREGKKKTTSFFLPSFLPSTFLPENPFSETDPSEYARVRKFSSVRLSLLFTFSIQDRITCIMTSITYFIVSIMLGWIKPKLASAPPPPPPPPLSALTSPPLLRALYNL